MYVQRRRNLSHAEPDDREREAILREVEATRFGRQGPVGHSVLPPPPPVPRDPINYP